MQRRPRCNGREADSGGKAGPIALHPQGWGAAVGLPAQFPCFLPWKEENRQGVAVAAGWQDEASAPKHERAQDETAQDGAPDELLVAEWASDVQPGVAREAELGAEA